MVCISTDRRLDRGTAAPSDPFSFGPGHPMIAAWAALWAAPWRAAAIVAQEAMREGTPRL